MGVRCGYECMSKCPIHLTPMVSYRNIFILISKVKWYSHGVIQKYAGFTHSHGVIKKYAAFMHIVTQNTKYAF